MDAKYHTEEINVFVQSFNGVEVKRAYERKTITIIIIIIIRRRGGQTFFTLSRLLQGLLDF